jgi:hypothetical protein
MVSGFCYQKCYCFLVMRAAESYHGFIGGTSQFIVLPISFLFSIVPEPERSNTRQLACPVSPPQKLRAVSKPTVGEVVVLNPLINRALSEVALALWAMPVPGDSRNAAGTVARVFSRNRKGSLAPTEAPSECVYHDTQPATAAT